MINAFLMAVMDVLGFEVKDLCVPHDDIHCLIM
jgi:hypothetical protein